MLTPWTCLYIAVGIVSTAASSPTPLYKDATAPIPARVADLVGRMTLEEKQAQLGYGGGSLCNEEDAKKYPLGVGGVYADGLECTNAGQAWLMNSTRLGIPVSYFAETTHSGGAGGTTCMPMPVSQGATWNVTLVEEIGRINALELRSSGGDQGLSPILQVCTDPRFSRMEENFSEDPMLVAYYGVAAVRGLQGRDGLGGADTYLGSPQTRIASQAKHFAMYGAGSKDGYTPMGGGPNMRTVFEVYLRPWRDYAQAGGRGVMASHNMIDWVPVHGNKKMLTDTLRNRFGLLNGYIGSDNTNVEGLSNYFRGYAMSDDDAAVLSMTAGVDQDMPGAAFLNAAKYVRDGQLENETLDRAVSNILTKKFASGLFDNPKVDPSMASNVNSPIHRGVAREAAIQGSVLLKNDGALLPLDGSKIKNIALIGPLADDQTAIRGGYSPATTGSSGTADTVTVKDALLKRGFNLTIAPGSDAGRGGPAMPANGIETAVAAAKSADFAVVVVGAISCTCCERCGNGEAGDRQDLDLEGQQLALLQAVSNATQNLVIVLVHGRPLTFGPGNLVLDSIPALLATWRPGEEGGNAIVDIILGDAVPSGRLAQAWPRSVGGIHGPANPWFQTHSSMTGGNYFSNGDGTPISPLFPFGYGLSYTTFNFTNLNVSPTGISGSSLNNGTSLASVYLTLTIDVKNLGDVDASVPIMAVYEKETRLVVRYMRMLAGFTKIHVPASKSTTAEIQVSLKDLARYDPEQAWVDLKQNPVMGAYVIDGGQYTFTVGDCVSAGQVWDDNDTCPKTRQQSVSVTIGNDGDHWIYL